MAGGEEEVRLGQAVMSSMSQDGHKEEDGVCNYEYDILGHMARRSTTGRGRRQEVDCLGADAKVEGGQGR